MVKISTNKNNIQFFVSPVKHQKMKLRGFVTATTIISVYGETYLLGNRGFPF